MLTSLFILDSQNYGVTLRVRSSNDTFAHLEPRRAITEDLMEDLEEICRDSAALRPITNLRTRHRAIMRCLKHIGVYPSPSSGFTSLEPGQNLPANCLFSISRNGQVNRGYHGYTRFFTHANSFELFEEVLSDLPHVRSYGARPTRRVGATFGSIDPVFPREFRELRMNGHHDQFRELRLGGQQIALGMELELIKQGSARIMGNPDWMYIQPDGSLPSSGVEVTSKPADWKQLAAEFEKFLKHNKAARLQPTSSCGMHVHINREWLGDDGVDKLTELMYDHSHKRVHRRTAYREFLQEIIAKRRPNNFWNWSRDNAESGYKYSALNTGPNRTVEIRIFASTTNPHLIKRRLQWVTAIAQKAKREAAIAAPEDSEEVRNLSYDLYLLAQYTEYQSTAQRIIRVATPASLETRRAMMQDLEYDMGFLPRRYRTAADMLRRAISFIRAYLSRNDLTRMQRTLPRPMWMPAQEQAA